MPSPIGHMLGGMAAGLIVNGRTPTAGLVAFAVAAAIPDADLLLGVHRGASHSLGAAAIAGVVALAAWPALTRPGDGGRLRFALAIAAAYATHALLDSVSDDTTPPLGLMAFWPFSTEFYQAPFHVFLPVNRRYWLVMAWLQNLRAVIRELLVLVPLLWLAWWFRGRR